MTDQNLRLLIKKIYPDAIEPSYASEDSIGMDVFAYGNSYDWLKPNCFTKVKTGICMELWNDETGESVKNGYYFRIAPKSGLALNDGIDVLAGVVDLDYRGEISVVLINFGNEEFIIEHGTKIAQIIIEKATKSKIEVVDTLTMTQRGNGGFGSTGRISTPSPSGDQP